MKEIKLTQGQVALVDEDDFEELNKYSWQAQWCKNTQSFYAYRKISKNKKRVAIAMHREVCDCPFNLVVDHINHDTLDNRNKNLRVATYSQNQMNLKIKSNNTSGVKGVSWRKDIKKWVAFLKKDRKQKNLGHFYLKCQAVKARKDAELKYFGEYTYNN